MKNETKNHPDYGGYNDLPAGYQYISHEEFIKQIFHYCISEPDSKQVYVNEAGQKAESMLGSKLIRLRLFNLDYQSCPAMGYGIELSYEGIPSKEVVKYFRYGNPDTWRTFEIRFAAQFAGDNS